MDWYVNSFAFRYALNDFAADIALAKLFCDKTNLSSFNPVFNPRFQQYVVENVTFEKSSIFTGNMNVLNVPKQNKTALW